MGWASRCDAGANSTANQFPAQRTIDRLAGQSDRSGYGGDAVAFVVKLANHVLLFFRDLDPCASLATAPSLAVSLRFGDACQLPFLANFGFVGSNAGENPGHQTPGWGGKVEAFPQRYKTNAQDLQFVQQRQQTFGRSAQAIQSSDADLGNLPTANISQQPFQAGAFHRRAGEPIPIPHDFIRLGFGPRLQIGFLAAGFLPLRAADPQTDSDRHAFPPAHDDLGVHTEVSSLQDAFAMRKFVFFGVGMAGTSKYPLSAVRRDQNKNGLSHPLRNFPSTFLQAKQKPDRARIWPAHGLSSEIAHLGRWPLLTTAPMGRFYMLCISAKNSSSVSTSSLLTSVASLITGLGGV